MCPADCSSLPYLEWTSRNVSHEPSAISLQYIEQSIPVWHRFEDEDLRMTLPLDEKVLRDLGAMEEALVWLVIMKTTVLHAPRKTKDVAASGLFERLEDAPIRILSITDCDNNDEITALSTLADALKRKVSIEPRQDCGVWHNKLRDKLRKMGLMVFRDDDAVTLLRPAAMFRLRVGCVDVRIDYCKVISRTTDLRCEVVLVAVVLSEAGRIY